ncbi:MAG: hypothetical protein AAGD11_20945 [Planctomycetota bacterium]
MSNLMTAWWPSVCALSAVAVSAYSFYRQYLEVRRLELQIKDLEQKLAKENNQIERVRLENYREKVSAYELLKNMQTTSFSIVLILTLGLLGVSAAITSTVNASVAHQLSEPGALADRVANEFFNANRNEILHLIHQELSNARDESHRNQ